jgi:hypothetical protein
MQSTSASRSTVSFQSDKIAYYASVFVYEPAQKNNFINYSASLHAFESKLNNPTH